MSLYPSGVLVAAQIDFGTKPVSEATFVVMDATITADLLLYVLSNPTPPSGLPIDLWYTDPLRFFAAAGAGQVTIYATTGSRLKVIGKRNISYGVSI